MTDHQLQCGFAAIVLLMVVVAVYFGKDEP